MRDNMRPSEAILSHSKFSSTFLLTSISQFHLPPPSPIQPFQPISHLIIKVNALVYNHSTTSYLPLHPHLIQKLHAKPSPARQASECPTHHHQFLSAFSSSQPILSSQSFITNRWDEPSRDHASPMRHQTSASPPSSDPARRSRDLRYSPLITPLQTGSSVIPTILEGLSSLAPMRG
ncbi:hypothetical protein BDV19DRAFT_357051 [Aspergillus venezuelensis]